MEQAHTRLIAQLKERIAAPDNTPLYLKFAETVKNAVRSGVLAHGNILPGERDLSQLCGEVIVSAWWLCGERKALRP